LRDPKRISRILKKIEERWECVPDWRLGQLLVNTTQKFEMIPFYIEDDELEEALDNWTKVEGGE